MNWWVNINTEPIPPKWWKFYRLTDGMETPCTQIPSNPKRLPRLPSPPCVPARAAPGLPTVGGAGEPGRLGFLSLAGQRWRQPTGRSVQLLLEVWVGTAALQRFCIRVQ